MHHPRSTVPAPPPAGAPVQATHRDLLRAALATIEQAITTLKQQPTPPPQPQQLQAQIAPQPLRPTVQHHAAPPHHQQQRAPFRRDSATDTSVDSVRFIVPSSAHGRMSDVSTNTDLDEPDHDAAHEPRFATKHQARAPVRFADEEKEPELLPTRTFQSTQIRHHQQTSFVAHPQHSPMRHSPPRAQLSSSFMSPSPQQHHQHQHHAAAPAVGPLNFLSNQPLHSAAPYPYVPPSAAALDSSAFNTSTVSQSSFAQLYHARTSALGPGPAPLADELVFSAPANRSAAHAFLTQPTPYVDLLRGAAAPRPSTASSGLPVRPIVMGSMGTGSAALSSFARSLQLHRQKLERLDDDDEAALQSHVAKLRQPRAASSSVPAPSSTTAVRPATAGPAAAAPSARFATSALLSAAPSAPLLAWEAARRQRDELDEQEEARQHERTMARLKQALMQPLPRSQPPPPSSVTPPLSIAPTTTTTIEPKPTTEYAAMRAQTKAVTQRLEGLLHLDDDERPISPPTAPIAVAAPVSSASALDFSREFDSRVRAMLEQHSHSPQGAPPTSALDLKIHSTQQRAARVLKDVDETLGHSRRREEQHAAELREREREKASRAAREPPAHEANPTSTWARLQEELRHEEEQAHARRRAAAASPSPARLTVAAAYPHVAPYSFANSSAYAPSPPPTSSHPIPALQPARELMATYLQAGATATAAVMANYERSHAYPTPSTTARLSPTRSLPHQSTIFPSVTHAYTPSTTTSRRSPPQAVSPPSSTALPVHAYQPPAPRTPSPPRSREPVFVPSRFEEPEVEIEENMAPLSPPHTSAASFLAPTSTLAYVPRSIEVEHEAVDEHFVQEAPVSQRSARFSEDEDGFVRVEDEPLSAEPRNASPKYASPVTLASRELSAPTYRSPIAYGASSESIRSEAQESAHDQYAEIEDEIEVSQESASVSFERSLSPVQSTKPVDQPTTFSPAQVSKSPVREVASPLSHRSEHCEAPIEDEEAYADDSVEFESPTANADEFAFDAEEQVASSTSRSFHEAPLSPPVKVVSQQAIQPMVSQHADDEVEEDISFDNDDEPVADTSFRPMSPPKSPLQSTYELSPRPIEPVAIVAVPVPEVEVDDDISFTSSLASPVRATADTPKDASSFEFEPADEQRSPITRSAPRSSFASPISPAQASPRDQQSWKATPPRTPEPVASPRFTSPRSKATTPRATIISPRRPHSPSPPTSPEPEEEDIPVELEESIEFEPEVVAPILAAPGQQQEQPPPEPMQQLAAYEDEFPEESVEEAIAPQPTSPIAQKDAPVEPVAIATVPAQEHAPADYAQDDEFPAETEVSAPADSNAASEGYAADVVDPNAAAAADYASEGYWSADGEWIPRLSSQSAANQAYYDEASGQFYDPVTGSYWNEQTETWEYSPRPGGADWQPQDQADAAYDQDPQDQEQQQPYDEYVAAPSDAPIATAVTQVAAVPDEVEDEIEEDVEIEFEPQQEEDESDKSMHDDSTGRSPPRSSAALSPRRRDDLPSPRSQAEAARKAEWAKEMALIATEQEAAERAAHEAKLRELQEDEARRTQRDRKKRDAEDAERQEREREAAEQRAQEAAEAKAQADATAKAEAEAGSKRLAEARAAEAHAEEQRLAREQAEAAEAAAQAAEDARDAAIEAEKVRQLALAAEASFEELEEDIEYSEDEGTSLRAREEDEARRKKEEMVDAITLALLQDLTRDSLSAPKTKSRAAPLHVDAETKRVNDLKTSAKALALSAQAEFQRRRSISDAAHEEHSSAAHTADEDEEEGNLLDSFDDAPQMGTSEFHINLAGVVSSGAGSGPASASASFDATETKLAPAQAQGARVSIQPSPYLSPPSSRGSTDGTPPSDQSDHGSLSGNTPPSAPLSSHSSPSLSPRGGPVVPKDDRALQRTKQMELLGRARLGDLIAERTHIAPGTGAIAEEQRALHLAQGRSRGNSANSSPIVSPRLSQRALHHSPPGGSVSSPRGSFSLDSSVSPVAKLNFGSLLAAAASTSSPSRSPRLPRSAASLHFDADALVASIADEMMAETQAELTEIFQARRRKQLAAQSATAPAPVPFENEYEIDQNEPEQSPRDVAEQYEISHEDLSASPRRATTQDLGDMSLEYEADEWGAEERHAAARPTGSRDGDLDGSGGGDEYTEDGFDEFAPIDAAAITHSVTPTRPTAAVPTPTGRPGIITNPPFVRKYLRTLLSLRDSPDRWDPEEIAIRDAVLEGGGHDIRRLPESAFVEAERTQAYFVPHPLDEPGLPREFTLPSHSPPGSIFPLESQQIFHKLVFDALNESIGIYQTYWSRRKREPWFVHSRVLGTQLDTATATVAGAGADFDTMGAEGAPPVRAHVKQIHYLRGMALVQHAHVPGRADERLDQLHERLITKVVATVQRMHDITSSTPTLAATLRSAHAHVQMLTAGPNGTTAPPTANVKYPSTAQSVVDYEMAIVQQALTYKSVRPVSSTPTRSPSTPLESRSSSPSLLDLSCDSVFEWAQLEAREAITLVESIADSILGDMLASTASMLATMHGRRSSQSLQAQIATKLALPAEGASNKKLGRRSPMQF